MNNTDRLLETRGEEIESLFSISNILQTGLDRRTLAILLNLIETGVHPEALADVVIEMRTVAAAAQAAAAATNIANAKR